mmetsp:Transcript_11651/g.34697  ORF Transcript_11651/g.34697 Transcript_11651/m.34697 type:complete len:102 (+) Transcript_11651:239-544(+)
MTRGNQREIDRARAQARAAKHAGGGHDDGLTPAQRNERDRKALEEKKAAKAAAKEKGEYTDKKAGNPGKPGTGPGEKKAKKKKEDLSALFQEGLNVGKKKK